jgi:hypothetical protein
MERTSKVNPAAEYGATHSTEEPFVCITAADVIKLVIGYLHSEEQSHALKCSTISRWYIGYMCCWLGASLRMQVLRQFSFPPAHRPSSHMQ